MEKYTLLKSVEAVVIFVLGADSVVEDDPSTVVNFPPCVQDISACEYGAFCFDGSTVGNTGTIFYTLRPFFGIILSQTRGHGREKGNMYFQLYITRDGRNWTLIPSSPAGNVSAMVQVML